MKKLQPGFTVVELLIAISLAGILSVAAYGFFSSSISQYVKLSQDSQNLSDLAAQSQRIAKVLRGLTDITTALDNEIKVYAYFSPVDQYVSEVRYYKNAGGTILYADVTPLTANPPIGTLITANKKTYTIIDPFKTISGTNLFTYLDSGGTTLPTPIADQHTIKGVKINLSVPTIDPVANQVTTSLQVSLRNRKTNL